MSDREPTSVMTMIGVGVVAMFVAYFALAGVLFLDQCVLDTHFTRALPQPVLSFLKVVYRPLAPFLGRHC